MRTDAAAPRSLGLSCYTENLAHYLAARLPDATDLLARSVRLAVRPDGPCFSHHARALNDLPGGRRLAYRGAATAAEALAGIAEEVSHRGLALAVADSGALPWLSGEADDHAPHLLVVDGRSGEDGTWHVVDAFAALFSTGGSQEPFGGTLTDAEFTALLAFPRGLSAVHRGRTALAFGYPVALPARETFQWLAEEEGTTGEELPGGPWLTGPAALEATAELLLEDITRRRPDSGGTGGGAGVLEDAWAAARHHLFRDRRLLEDHGPRLDRTQRQSVEATTARWRELPRMLRFAADSARRGRPRPTLVRGAFHALAEAEAAASRLHAALGYGTPAARPAGRLHRQQAGR